MVDNQTMSSEIVSALDLAYEPVGIFLYDRNDPLPDGIEFSDREYKSYCQVIVLAGQGESIMVKKEQMGCKLGTSVLGFEKDMAAFLDDGVLEKYGVGLFATEEASANTINKSYYLEKGQTQAAFIAPLSKCKKEPQVIVFTSNSEQIMWLLYALNYERGGAMNLPQSGGALGGCADITVLPLTEGQPNVTFLGLGCRIKSAVDACHLMMGVKGGDIIRIHSHLKAMAKPIAMLKKAQIPAV